MFQIIIVLLLMQNTSSLDAQDKSTVKNIDKVIKIIKIINGVYWR